MSALRDKLAAGESVDVLVMPTNLLDPYQKEGVVSGEDRAVLGLVPINAVVPHRGAEARSLDASTRSRQTIAEQPRHHLCDARRHAERQPYGPTDRAIWRRRAR